MTSAWENEVERNKLANIERDTEKRSFSDAIDACNDVRDADVVSPTFVTIHLIESAMAISIIFNRN